MKRNQRAVGDRCKRCGEITRIGDVPTDNCRCRTPAERIAEMRGWIDGAGPDDEVHMPASDLAWLLARIAELETRIDQ